MPHLELSDRQINHTESRISAAVGTITDAPRRKAAGAARLRRRLVISTLQSAPSRKPPRNRC